MRVKQIPEAMHGKRTGTANFITPARLPGHSAPPVVDAGVLGMHVPSMSAAVTNYKIGNEKLVKVLAGASSHLRGLLDRQGRPDGALRIAVVGGGCSGLQYQLMFDDQAKPSDHAVDASGVRVVVDEKSALYLVGTTLDYVDTLMESGFKIQNPNAKNSCGCGQSFSA